MVKIATPISELFADKRTAVQIMEASDCLECRDAFLEASYPHQNLFHCELELIKPWNDENRTHVLSVLQHKTDLHVFSFHAASNCATPMTKDGMFHSGGDVFSRDQLLQHARTNAQWLQSIVPDNVSLSIENNNYYPTSAYELVTDGDFLSAIVEENNISFLLDLAHAHITAHNKNIPYEKYIDSLPCARALQIHICKHTIDHQGMARDTHEPPDENVLEEVLTFLRRFPNISYVTVEYYRDKGILLQSLDQLRSTLDAL